MSNEVYLGDGLYASIGPLGIYLRAPRPREVGGDHYVVLEPDVFEALIQYAIKIGWLEKGQVIQ